MSLQLSNFLNSLCSDAMTKGLYLTEVPSNRCNALLCLSNIFSLTNMTLGYNMLTKHVQLVSLTTGNFTTASFNQFENSCFILTAYQGTW